MSFMVFGGTGATAKGKLLSDEPVKILVNNIHTDIRLVPKLLISFFMCNSGHVSLLNSNTE